MGCARHSVLAASIWAVVGGCTAAPLHFLVQPLDRHDSPDNIHVFAGGGDAYGNMQASAAEEIPMIPARPAEYRSLVPVLITPDVGKRTSPTYVGGLQWSLTGALPTLEYHLAPNQVLRLRGMRSGALITVRWDF